MPMLSKNKRLINIYKIILPLFFLFILPIHKALALTIWPQPNGLYIRDDYVQMGEILPVLEIPTYDYGENGLLRFHFVLNPIGWNSMLIGIGVYKEEYQDSAVYFPTYGGSNSIPSGITHLAAQAIESPPNYFRFKFYNEDTGEEVYTGTEPWWIDYPQNPTLWLTLCSYNGGTYVNRYASTPMAPVRNLNLNSKTPVLIIPGVLGTDIFKGDEKLWLNLARNFTDVGDQFMDPLQFEQNLKPIDTSLNLGNLVLSPFTGQHFYDLLIQEFQNQGYIEGQDLFTFPYDWRYGVSGKYGNGSTTVDLLKQRIEAILAQTGSSKVDIIAHSIGGLLVKQYAMNYPADNHIGKAVFVGVPNTGSPKAIKVLLLGDNFGIPWLADSEMLKIGQNLPVVYDLMPSEKYYAEKNGPIKIYSGQFFTTSEKELNYNETNSYLTDSKGLNSQAVINARNLHTIEYDNFDLRTTGVDLYAIDGCKTGTLAQVWEFQKFDGTHIRYNSGGDTPGDGTVPLESSTNLPIDQNHKYYSLNADHGKMPSQDGIRQKIVNIISGSHLSTESPTLHRDLITQDITKCKLKGKAISIFSPLNIEVFDQFNNRLGFYEDGSIQNDIPNADFNVFGEHKFVYLPDDEGQIYLINLKGTGNGTFTIKNQDIEDNQATQTEIFANLPVTSSLVGQVNLGSTTTLSLDTNGDGIIDQTLEPSSVLNPNQSEDLLPPISTLTLSGAEGAKSYFRSNVQIVLSAEDLAQTDAEASGVLKTYFKLDDSSTTSPYSIYQNPIIL